MKIFQSLLTYHAKPVQSLRQAPTVKRGRQAERAARAEGEFAPRGKVSAKSRTSGRVPLREIVKFLLMIQSWHKNYFEIGDGWDLAHLMKLILSLCETLPRNYDEDLAHSKKMIFKRKKYLFKKKNHYTKWNKNYGD